MAFDQSQRPQFYEGQYLGADDLNGIVEHARHLQARHDLGGHTWGIAVGLELKESMQPGTNQLGIYVQPGLAWDGFGRQIILPEPTPVPASLFNSIRHISSDEPKGRLVEVWLRYQEAQTQAPPYGFEICDDSDQYARWQESFEFEVGPQPNPDDRHSQVSVGGRSVDPEQALRTFDPADPLVRDESIPFQSFPSAGQLDRWLIPLGYVRWHPGPIATQPGKFEKRDTADLGTSRLFRRYIGLIAEELFAPAGLLHLRSRSADPSTKPRSTDLVRVEGSLRVDEDARLFGSRLSLLNPDGNDEGVPLFIQRGERAAAGGKALQVQIGKAAAGKNAFEVGPTDTSGSFIPKLAVLDNGNVELRGGDLLFKATAEDPGDIIFQNSNAVQKARIWSNPLAGAALYLSSGDNTPDLAIDSSGSVGIGTTSPGKPLTIRAQRTGEELIGFEDPSGTLKWHINQNLGGNTPGLNFSETGVDDGRLFLKAGGNVGIGTTSPANKLHVNGNSANFALTFTNSANTVGKRGYRIAFDNDRLTFQRADDSGNFAANQVAIAQDTGDVGIGTMSPSAKLDVAGSFRLGGGTILSKVQCGTVNIGSKTTQSTRVTISFPQPFVGTPKVVALPRGDGGNYPDVFAFTTVTITPLNCTLNVLRLDAPTGWGQNLDLDWLAWE